MTFYEEVHDVLCNLKMNHETNSTRRACYFCQDVNGPKPSSISTYDEVLVGVICMSCLKELGKKRFLTLSTTSTHPLWKTQATNVWHMGCTKWAFYVRLLVSFVYVFFLLGIWSQNPGDWSWGLDLFRLLSSFSSGPQQRQLPEMHLQMQSEALNEDILASAQGYLPDSFGKHVNIIYNIIIQ